MIDDKNVVEAEKTSGKGKDLTTAGQWRLIFWRFTRHKLAMTGAVVLLIFYLTALFAPFISPYNAYEFYDDFADVPPQRMRFHDDNGFTIRPFYHPLIKERNMETLKLEYERDATTRIYVKFFTPGAEYRLFGLFKSNIHLFGGSDSQPLFLFGSDNMGRDLLSRTILASRISLTIGLVGVAITFVLGCLIGGLSGYYGGVVDAVIQRIIEFLLAIPTLPLWMALSAALPREWTQIQTYFAIVVILSILSWTGLARVVRGKLISIREEEFILAARVAGASDLRLIIKHLLPSFTGYLIVNLTLSIPAMILGETALSFLGLGLRAPVISWGVLLSNAQNVRTVALYPWIMLPGIFVVLVVLAFNFLGDGLRDAADPYKEM
ncbi:MAG: ABC transporter permease [Spirochaetales bacterium]|jgi:peptide/nickel transport system permease protein|nr:ABC transporter permease [Spirochaetales bacterium]